KLALALYRSGRQADALRALAAARSVLRDELGLEPGAQLRGLEASILAQDPGLDLPPAPPAAPAAARESAPPAASKGSTLPAGGPEAPGAAGARAAPLVGREAERAELLAAYGEAAADARFVVLEGDPGIGKTRLAEDLAAAAAAAGSL